MQKFWHIFKKAMIIQACMMVVMLFVVTLMSAVREQKTLVCSSIHVDIDYNSGLSYLTTDQVVAKINDLADGDAVGKTLPSLDLKGIERGLLQDPFIAGAKVYIDHARTLHAEITQKRPILRVMNNDGVGYYLSDKGDKIPLCSTFTAHVPLAIGEVETHQDSGRDSIVLSQLFALAKYFEQDTLTGALIDHAYVLSNGELELYPKFGYHTIEFGRADQTMKEKFDKLKIFYTQGLAKVGWDKYKIINLKYSGQVVCQRSETEEEAKKKAKIAEAEEAQKKKAEAEEAQKNKPEAVEKPQVKVKKPELEQKPAEKAKKPESEEEPQKKDKKAEREERRKKKNKKQEKKDNNQ